MLLTIREVSQLLHIKHSTLYAWPHRDGEDKEPTGHDMEDILTDFGIPELEADWNHVIEGLRWLTAHSRATL